MSKKVNRYEIRFYPLATSYSRWVGCKMRLVEFRKAVRLVARLKKSGVDAFYSKMEINYNPSWKR